MEKEISIFVENLARRNAGNTQGAWFTFDLARQQISKIKGAEDDNRQVVVSTHSPLLASKLNVNNLKWINDEGNFVSFKNISSDTAEFF